MVGRLLHAAVAAAAIGRRSGVPIEAGVSFDVSGRRRIILCARILVEGALSAISQMGQAGR